MPDVGCSESDLGLGSRAIPVSDGFVTLGKALTLSEPVSSLTEQASGTYGSGFSDAVCLMLGMVEF